jgi:Holliday junction resolvasome RuvABC ATP-dependent DNA helicase subunit
MAEPITVNDRGMVRHILENYEPHELEDALTEMIGELRLPTAEPESIAIGQFLRELGSITYQEVWQVRTSIAVGPADRVASEVTQDIMRKLGPESTIGQVEDVLVNALCWLRLFTLSRMAAHWIEERDAAQEAVRE